MSSRSVPKRISRSSIFGEPRALPRGPHQLTRGQVEASQRTRLMAAVADLVAEKGYAGATVGSIADRAGVSRRTFYEHFGDKDDLFMAAYDTWTGVLMARMSDGIEPEQEWHAFIAAILDGYLGTLAQEPKVARAFIVEILAAGPAARTHRREIHRQFAGFLQQAHELIREQDPTLEPMPDETYLAIVGGISEVVSETLETAPTTAIELKHDLLLWITAMVQGAAVARQAIDDGPPARVKRVAQAS